MDSPVAFTLHTAYAYIHMHACIVHAGLVMTTHTHTLHQAKVKAPGLEQVGVDSPVHYNEHESLDLVGFLSSSIWLPIFRAC